MGNLISAITQRFLTPFWPHFDSRWVLLENNLWWKTTFAGRRPSIEDDLWWETTFDGRWKRLLCSTLYYALWTIFHKNLFTLYLRYPSKQEISQTKVTNLWEEKTVYKSRGSAVVLIFSILKKSPEFAQRGKQANSIFQKFLKFKLF